MPLHLPWVGHALALPATSAGSAPPRDALRSRSLTSALSHEPPLARSLRRLLSRCVVAMPYEQAREACNRLLVELDEDIRNYIIDMLGGDESEEEMKAAVSDFLVSTEHCADEDAAMVKVTELFASLSARPPEGGMPPKAYRPAARASWPSQGGGCSEYVNR